MTDLKTRYVGICPVCGAEFKLANEKMVHHGYKRPGDGSIYGDCFGVGYPAYELSFEGCQAYAKASAENRDMAQAHLKKLENYEIRELYREVHKGAWANPELIKVSIDSEDNAERAWFEACRTRDMKRAQQRIAICNHEIERMVRSIEAWELKPVRTVKEAAAVVDLEKGKRRAEREAKRAEKSAKQAELKAKYARWEAEKAALIAKYKETFEKLAASPEDLQSRQREARRAWVEMHKAQKKSYLRFYPNKLECNDALVVLGLAKVKDSGDGRTWVSHAGMNGHLP